MTGFRRRRPESDEVQADETELPSEIEVQPAAPTSPPPQVRIPGHIERSLIMLTTKLQTCIERLDALELRVDDITEHSMSAPSHSDVMEVRMHSAKLAAELARATVELRGEIGIASDEARRAARTARSAADDVASRDDEVVRQDDEDGYDEQPHPFSQTA
jgi:hypothetical protein